MLTYVHGFNVADRGVGTIGVLKDEFNGYCFRYGRASLWDVYFSNSNLAEALFSLFWNKKDWESAVLFGHSNGCALIHKVLDMGLKEYNAEPRAVIYIAPALNANLVSPLIRTKINVLHSRHDNVVKLSSFLPALIWGRMGNSGALRTDEYRNIDCSLWSKGHSDYFSPENRGKLFELIRGLDVLSERVPNLRESA